MAEAVASSLVGKVVDSLLTKVKKEIGYMWSSKENVEKLRREAEKLKIMKERVELKIKSANDKGNRLLPGVERWVDEADAHITKTEEFLQEEAHAKKTCFNLQMCVNLNILHHYGKDAINKVPSLEQHQKDGASYDGDVSIPTASPGILELYPRENIDDLDTHKSLLENITSSVLDENIQITGIYGIGGVGKTTLAIEVAARVKDLFALVVFVTISQHVDAASIKTQVDIAAKRIIHKGEKVLIIMDDVWTELKLHDLGIPCGKTFPSCKILLTSRSSSVCTAMNAQAIIYVESLPFEEGWILFKRVVGERVETDAKLKQVARKVVDGCGGLPLILQVVGKALKDKDNFIEWEEALVNIGKDETSDIGGALRVEFARLKLSYDYLKSEQVKLVFLLCSMFPEDFNVPLERLAYYCVGLQIFTDLGSLEAARNKVKGAVKILKSSCLLLDGNGEFTTKMHDVVRDVALLIASTGDNKFLVEARKNLTEWQPRNESLESYTGISLMFNDIPKLPDYELNIPRLKIFLMQGYLWSQISEISDEFTQAMKKVEVIDFEYNSITSLPKSLNELRELRMLNLSENRSLCDVSILGELNHLEILILNGTGITEIPQEIGKLVNLRLFHVKKCPGLSHIAPGVLSKLRCLEELSIGYYPVEKGKYNSLVEISKLLKLTFLDLYVPHICLFPEGDYLTRLKRFSIHIGADVAYHVTGDRTLILDQLDYLDISHLMHVRKFIEACNGISLLSIKNLDNIMPMMSCECLGKKFINLFRCDNLLCLVDSSAHEGVKENTMFLSEVEEICMTFLSSLKVIWNCPNQYISLHNLVRCTIKFCPKLEKLFTVSVAQGLVNLKKLEIRGCHSLKEVISDGDEETSTGEIDIFVPAKNIMFRRLAKISLAKLDNLTSFYPRNAIIKYPSLVNVKIKGCDKMEKWGYGTHDTPKLQLVNKTTANGSTIDETLAKDREADELKTILPKVRNEDKKKGVLSNLRWLEELSIGYHPVEEGKYNSLVEIGKLSKLTFLNLYVPHICLLPEGDYLKRLKRFSIQIAGSERDSVNGISGNRSLILDMPYLDISHLMHYRKLIEVCNNIRLVLIENLDNIMPKMSCEGLGLKHITLEECANLLCLVDSRVLDEMQTFHPSETHEGVKEDTRFLSEVEQLRLFFLSSLKVIWNCPDQYISLNNLVTLDIIFCVKLEKLFIVSVAQGLVSLQKLKIRDCDSLKEVISDGDEETSTGEIDTVVPAKMIVFPRLAEIELCYMLTLTSFYPRNATIKYPSLVNVTIMHCNEMKKWGYGTHDTPNLQFVWINNRKVNGSTIDEALAKDREAYELRTKQRHNQIILRKKQYLVSTEEGPSSVCSSKCEE